MILVCKTSFLKEMFLLRKSFRILNIKKQSTVSIEAAASSDPPWISLSLRNSPNGIVPRAKKNNISLVFCMMAWLLTL